LDPLSELSTGFSIVSGCREWEQLFQYIADLIDKSYRPVVALASDSMPASATSQEPMTEPTSEKRLANSLRTDRGCAAARPAEDGGRIDYMIDGAPGLRLRVSRDRRGQISRKWSLLYTPRGGGGKARIVLGAYPAVSLKAARAAALQQRGQIISGEDPAADVRSEKASDTFKQLAERWLTRHAKVKKRSWREDERMLKHDVYPELGDKKAGKVATADITAIVDAIMDRGSPYQANRVQVLLNTIFEWGKRRRSVKENPAADLDKPAEELKRKRFLSKAELPMFWHGLSAAPVTEGLQIALKLALLTGQRINELGLARQSEFDFTTHIWVVPGRREMPNGRKESGQKNGDDHYLPLTKEVEALLRRAIELSEGSEWLFPSPRPARGRHEGEPPPIGETAISRAYRRSRGRLGLPEDAAKDVKSLLADTRPHDLRRTWSTIAGDELGYDDFEIGLVLNHKTSRGSVTGSVYNQARYMKQKRRIMERVEKVILASI
jgi:integrase